MVLEVGLELAPPKLVLKPASRFSAWSWVLVFCFISTCFFSLEGGGRRVRTEGLVLKTAMLIKR